MIECTHGLDKELLKVHLLLKVLIIVLICALLLLGHCYYVLRF